MRLTTCHIQNFSSYEDLTFDFSNQGLALIYGPTGSGKSSLFDAASWIMFGVTAKNGSVDDVRGWYNLESPTIGNLTVELNDKTIVITRIRGKSGQNDLYWSEPSGEIKRGKDVTETQKMLISLLGIDSDLYLSAAYFCEFSPTGTFFLDKAKNQRDLFENIAPLDLAIHLAQRCVEERKEAKKILLDKNIQASKTTAKSEQIKDTLVLLRSDHDLWTLKQKEKVKELTVKGDNFKTEKESKIAVLQTKADRFQEDLNKKIDKILHDFEAVNAQLEALEGTKCQTCGRSEKDSEKNLLSYKVKEHKKAIRELSSSTNPYLEQMEAAKSQENHYGEQLSTASSMTSPFLSRIGKLEKEVANFELLQAAELKTIEEQESVVESINQLYDLSFTFRGELLKKAIKEIETSTNRYLELYFEAPLKVSFSIEGSDSLDINIQKDGYPCVYKQLSKGQRGLLKLAFSVSVMKAAANKAGIHFSNLYFDEALDGLDSELKVKAFSLFEELEKEHETVLLVDHATEFKTLFNKQYCVSLISDKSIIQLEDE